MTAYERVGGRIRERLIALKYVKPDGDLDIQRFCWDFRFEKTNVYNWLSERITPVKDLIRLCQALDCSAEWLLTGKERDPKAKPASGRPHRKTIRGVLLALTLGAVGALWPSPSVAAPVRTLSVRIDELTPSASVDYVRRRRFRRFRNLLRHLLHQESFSHGMAFAL